MDIHKHMLQLNKTCTQVFIGEGANWYKAMVEHVMEGSSSLCVLMHIIIILIERFTQGTNIIIVDTLLT